MSRTFKDKEPYQLKKYKREDRYSGYGDVAHVPEMKRKLKRELSRYNRRLLKQEGIVE